MISYTEEESSVQKNHIANASLTDRIHTTLLQYKPKTEQVLNGICVMYSRMASQIHSSLFSEKRQIVFSIPQCSIKMYALRECTYSGN